ncbi:MAG TPA: HAMP domain-containing sensor histidine kinase [Candidatus Binatia bacterium]|nr:HAMP domain-containing sensor histidine kinase [Candidatus Binatia bacterium]
MRLEPRGLRGRLALALTALAVLAAGLLALLFWIGEDVAEQASLQRLLRHELHLIVERPAPAEAGDAPTLRYFRPRATGEPLPPALAAVEPGADAEVLLDGQRYRVYATDVAPGDRAVLAYKLDLAQKRRGWLLAVLALGTSLVAALAWWLSGRIAGATLRPLDALVQQIEALDLERRDQRVHVDTADAELRVIERALNARMTELDALVERERAFAAAASHELRTSLTVVGGAAAVLREQQAPAAPLDRIERAVAQARQDLEALLALSRAREAPPPQRVALSRLLPELAGLQLEASPRRDVRIEWHIGEGETELPPGALSIVFGNLLRNALRAARGQVRIEADASALRISDDGPGLPAGFAGPPFRPLAPSRDGGSGMGLYIADTLARRQGWRLSLGAADGGGTRAELVFPAL